MAVRTLEHPALEHMAATPDIFRALLTGVSDRQAYWKPTPERFSIAELLEHLSHVEGHYFRGVTDRILADENPEISGYDTDSYIAAGAYRGRDAEESLAHWEEQRDDNIEFLRGLDPKILSRTGRHTVLGQFTLGNLLNEWALHDLGHVRQLAELVRAQLYYPEIGPFRAEYNLKP